MKICPNCNSHESDNTMFCTSCGADVSSIPPQNTAMQAQAPMSYYPKYSSFSWTDVCTIIGFISAIVGIFWCSVFLLPLGAICSLIGFLGNRTRGLAVAGLILSLVCGIIKICFELYRANLLPEWVTRGIFF